MPKRLVIVIASGLLGSVIGSVLLSSLPAVSEPTRADIDLREGKPPIPMGKFLAVTGGVMGFIMGGFIAATIGKTPKFNGPPGERPPGGRDQPPET